MKKLFSVIIFLGFCCIATAQDSLLVTANRHYADGEFSQAIALYQEVLNSQKVSAEVYYNLGNSQYKSGKYTQAIINYERALLLAPDDDDIRFNLSLANRHIQDAISPLPRMFLVRWWENISNNFSVDEWGKISVISFILVLLLTAIFIFNRSSAIKKLTFWIGILMILATVISYNVAAQQENRLTNQRNAIVTQPSITVKSSPSEGGTDLFLIHEGLKVQIKNQLGSWIEIRLADGNQGWLPDSSVEKI